MALGGLVAGLIFGLLVAWGLVSGLVIFVGVGLFLLGGLFPSPLRPFFGAAVFGFIVSWLVSSGVDML
jgi:hypothetical protein